MIPRNFSFVLAAVCCGSMLVCAYHQVWGAAALNAVAAAFWLLNSTQDKVSVDEDDDDE